MKDFLLGFYIRLIPKLTSRLLVSFFCLFLASQITLNAQAQDFPLGNLKGEGFSVEKNGKVIFTSSQLFFFKSQLKITQLSEEFLKFNVNVKLRQFSNSPEIQDNREDKFKIIWTTENQGELKNVHPNYKNDVTKFSLLNNKLIIKSWIERHGTWETQYYSFN